MNADDWRMSERENGFWWGAGVGMAVGVLLTFWIIYGGGV